MAESASGIKRDLDPQRAARAYVASLFLNQQRVVIGSNGEQRAYRIAADADMSEILGSAEAVAGQEIDLRLEPGVDGALLAVKATDDCGARSTVEGLAARTFALDKCIELVANQWSRHPEKPAGELLLWDGDALVGDPVDRPDLGLHELFSQMAAKQPGSVAIQGQDRSLSYAELEQKSDQLARELIAVGVGPGEVVATLIGRSCELYVSLLAILKSGAAYLPIDPEFPRDRQLAMLEDGECRVILVSGEQTVEADSAARVHIDLDRLNGEADAGARVARAGEDAAYVTFTSGSTGRPKAVVNTHRGAVNEVLSCIELWGLTGEDRIPQFASIGFDTAVEEIWSTWLAGARLLVMPPDVIRSHSYFMGWVESQRVTVLDLPTAFWHSVVSAMENGDAGLPKCLRLVIVGGEFARRAAYSSWKQIAGERVRWANTYGPTEAAVACIFFRDWCDGEFDLDVPIGRPIPNSVAYVVDAQGRQLPPGFAGELWLGGAGVAVGYRGLPEATSERFTGDPFSADDAARIYRTGDQVWIDREGRLRFIGRLDRQVKVRGFRVELDEVEDLLNGIGSVRDAAVRVIDEPDGGTELVAYVVADEPVERVRDHLHASLPAQMVPSRLVNLESLPKTKNGKIDYAQLPSPTMGSGAAAAVTPADPLVQLLLEEMRKVVGMPALLATDNFFASGGHSLRMMELIAALERRGMRIAPEALVRNPTAEGLAEFLRERRRGAPAGAHWSPLQALHVARTDSPVLILPHSTPGDVMGYGNLVNHLVPDISCYGLVARGSSPDLEPHTDLEEMASFYAEEIVSQLAPPYHLCGWCFGGMLALEIAHQLLERGEEVGRLILIDTEVPPMPGIRAMRARAKLKALAGFPIRKMVEYLWGKLPWSGAPADTGDPHVRDSDLYRINGVAYDNYLGKRYPGHIDEITSDIDLWDGLSVFYSEDRGGRAAASSSRTRIKGDHMSLMRDPVVAGVAARIRELLRAGSPARERE